MKFSDTKWNKEKVEQLLKKYGWNFKDDNYGNCNAYVEFFGKKTKVKLYVQKSCLEVSSPAISYWGGIRSYKKLEEALKYYNKEIANNIWKEMSFSKKIAFLSVKEYEEKGTTEILENLVDVLDGERRNIVSQLSALV